MHVSYMVRAPQVPLLLSQTNGKTIADRNAHQPVISAPRCPKRAPNGSR